MSGTLFGLGLSQQVDAEGVPLSGALLYLYQANTSTPVSTYADFALTNLQTFPIEADSAGRLPQIWVDNGSYRARLTTSAGVEVFDEASVTAIGASVVTGSGGSSGSSVDSTTIFQTGDPLWVPYAGTRSGWVRCNGRTISSGSGSGSERANSDTQSLFEYLWTNFSNSLCAVSGGRGATATADFSANKTIATLDMRGYGPFGLDDMGNSAASKIAGGTPTVAGSGAGAETVSLLQANLPSYNLDTSSLSVVLTNGTHVTHNTGGFDGVDTGGNDVSNGLPNPTDSDVTAALSGTLPSGGSGTAVNKMPPYRLGTYFMKL